MAKLGFEHPNSSKKKIDYEFDEWYQCNYGNPDWKSARSTRYYEMKKAWIASKEFYKKELKKCKKLARELK